MRMFDVKELIMKLDTFQNHYNPVSISIRNRVQNQALKTTNPKKKYIIKTIHLMLFVKLYHVMQ